MKLDNGGSSAVVLDIPLILRVAYSEVECSDGGMESCALSCSPGYIVLGGSMGVSCSEGFWTFPVRLSDLDSLVLCLGELVSSIPLYLVWCLSGFQEGSCVPQTCTFPNPQVDQNGEFVMLFLSWVFG